VSQLKLGLPKGSLEKSTIELFRKSGWKVTGMDRSYFPSIDDKSLTCSVVRAQEMSRYVEDGTLDAGITGRDWIQENNSEVEYVTELIYAKTSFRPTRWVLAVPHDSPVQKIEDLKGKKVATEMVNFTRRLFESHNTPVDVEFSWGATEAKAPDLVDAIVEITETGGSIRANKLRILDTLMVSTNRLIANKTSWLDPDKRRKIENIALLLKGAMLAEEMVGLKMNVKRADLDAVAELLPALQNPTISPLADQEWVAIEVMIEEHTIRQLIPALKRAGAQGLVEYPLNKVIY
jgi:ATP phosphoribosyltransferase